MTLDGLLTVIALLFTVYSVLPPSRQLALRFQVARADWAVLGSAFLAVHYLLFYDAAKAMGVTPGWRLYRIGITPQNTSYFVVFIAIAFVFLHARWPHLTERNISRFRKLVEELLYDEQYPELLSLLEMHWPHLVRMYRGEVPPERWFRKGGGRLAESSHDDARVIVRDVLLAPDFVRALARRRPYFGLEIVKENFDRVFDFFNMYMAALMADEGSVLYSEVRNSNNCSSSPHRYFFERSRLLSFLFKDIAVATRLHAWKAVGEFLVSELDRLKRLAAGTDPNNKAFDQPFNEEGCWSSPLFVGIRYFDIMVSEAICQGHQDHMWMMYYEYVVRQIARQYAPEKDADPLAEWPTRYSFLVYQLISAITDWLRSIAELPETNPNREITSELPERHEVNPLKWAIVLLGSCSRHVLVSGMGDRFKQYIGDIILTTYFELRQREATVSFARLLATAFKRGGERRNGGEYQRRVLQVFANHDMIPHLHEYVDELRRFLESGDLSPHETT